MPREINEDQLVHYFAGECSEHEAAEIEAWINADPERKRRVARLRQLWEAAGERPQDRSDPDAMWNRLSQRLGPPEREAEPERKTERPERAAADRMRRGARGRDRRARTLSLSKSSRRIMVAASIVALILTTWAFYDGPLSSQDTYSMRTITTEAGQRAHVRLGDGTHVTLNANSELTIPPDFQAEERNVRLRGQAYFEVKPDEDAPFLVHARETVTQVLGTRFDVGAYPDDETIRVVVAEGKVSVRAARHETDREVTLTERQMAAFSASDSVIVKDVDPSAYLAWTEGQLVFRDASFEEVVQRIRNWYGLQVEFAGSPETVDHLNASFSDEPVGEVLSIIAETLDLQYRREGRTIIFFPAGSGPDSTDEYRDERWGLRQQ